MVLFIASRHGNLMFQCGPYHVLTDGVCGNLLYKNCAVRRRIGEAGPMGTPAWKNTIRSTQGAFHHTHSSMCHVYGDMPFLLYGCVLRGDQPPRDRSNRILV